MSETLMVIILFALFITLLFYYRHVLENVEASIWFKNPFLKLLFLILFSGSIGLVLFLVARILSGNM